MKKLNLYLKNKKWNFSDFLLLVNIFIIFSFTIGSDGLNIFETVFQILRDLESIDGSDIYYFGRTSAIFSSFSSTSLLYLALASFIVAFVKFSFLHKKRLSTAIFSFPQKRSNILKENAFIPIIILTLSVIIAKTICLLANALKYGMSFQLFGIFIASTLIYIQYTLLGYTTGILGRMLTGRMLEGFLAGISLAFFPKAIYLLFHIFASSFIYGYTEASHSDLTQMLDPLRHLFDICYTYNNASSTTPVPYTSIIASLFTISALCVILLFIKRYFSKSFKIEKIGFKGINKYINIISSLTLSIYVGEIVFDGALYFDFAEKYYLLKPFLAILSIFVCALLINSLINGKIKFTREKCVLSGVFLVLSSVIALITLTGGLGYEKRIPDTKRIKLIEISTPLESAIYSLSYKEGYLSTFGDYCYSYEFPVAIESESDIEIIKNIHKFAINDKKHTNHTADGFEITYHLDNGTAIRRKYEYISTELSEATLAVWDLSALKDYQKRILDAEIAPDVNNYPYNYFETDDSEFPQYSPYVNSFDYEKGTHEVGVVSKDFDYISIRGKNDSELSLEEFKAIKDALYKDICENSYKEWFFPEETYGYLAFSGYFTNTPSNDIAYTSDTPISSIDDEYSNCLAEFANGINIDLFKYFDKAKNQTNYAFVRSDIDKLNLIPITSETKNLLALLEANGYKKYLAIQDEVEAVFLADIEEMLLYRRYRDAQPPPQMPLLKMLATLDFMDLELDLNAHTSFFFGDRLTAFDVAQYYFDEEGYSIENGTPPVQKIVGEKAQEELLKKSHSNYFCNGSGKLIYVIYKNADNEVYYIP